MATDKIDYIVMLITEFAKRYHLSPRQAYRYIARYKGIEVCLEHYGIMHTLLFFAEEMEVNYEALSWF